MAVLLTPPYLQFFDDNGNPLSGGKIYTYVAGTLTPKATYTDASETTPLSNPVVLDSAGRATIWISGSYYIDVKTSADVAVKNTDNITAFNTSSSSINSLLPSQSGNAGKYLTTDGNNVSWGESSDFASVADIVAGTVGKVVSAAELFTFLQDNNLQKIWHAQHSVASGTNGGSKNNAAWDTLPINTEVTDTLGVTLTSNQFVLPAGTYDIDAISAVYACAENQMRLRNVTDGVTLLIGVSSQERVSTATGGSNFLRGRFTIGASKTLELQHYSTGAQATNGLGYPVNSGVNEIYRDVLIRKVA